MAITKKLLSFLLLLAAQTAFAQEYPDRRPAEGQRLFRSEAVEAKIEEVSARIGDARLRALFRNCFPNTLDTTVHSATTTIRRGLSCIPATSMPCGSGIPGRRCGLT